MNQRSLALWTFALALIGWARAYVIRNTISVSNYADSIDCWVWSKGGDGRYGHAYLFNTRIKAHVLAYVAWGGYLRRHHIVSHGCDNPPCCNPAHLSGESQSMNMSGCYRKGRSPLVKVNGR